MIDSSPSRKKCYPFTTRQRLHGVRQFEAVFKEGICRSRGCILIYGRPNGMGYNRLGLTVSRRVGIATSRNRIKRLLREAFRQSQPDWPVGYDIVVVVRPHDVMTLSDYQRAMLSAVESIDRKWRDRTRTPSRSPGHPGKKQ